jgi:hypothetical protein
MANLEVLKQKYAPVLESMQRFAPYRATLEAVDLAGEPDPYKLSTSLSAVS